MHFYRQIYREDDRPFYRRRNQILISITAWNIVMAIFVKGYFMWRNKTRSSAWVVMTVEERDHYLRTTKDEGNKGLDFRFAH